MVEWRTPLCNTLWVLYLLFHNRDLGVDATMIRTFKLSEQESKHLQISAMCGDKQTLELRDKLMKQYQGCEVTPNLETVDLGAMIGEFDRRGLVVKVRDKK
jgi:hypothetical protein